MIQKIKNKYYTSKYNSRNFLKSFTIWDSIVVIILSIMLKYLINKPIPVLYKLMHHRIKDGYSLIFLSPFVLLLWILVTPLVFLLILTYAIIFSLFNILYIPTLILIPFEAISDFTNKAAIIDYQISETGTSLTLNAKNAIAVHYDIRWFNLGGKLQKCSVHKTSVFGRNKICPECEYEYNQLKKEMKNDGN